MLRSDLDLVPRLTAPRAPALPCVRGTRRPADTRYWLIHAALPSAALGLLMGWLVAGGGDLVVADAVYSIQGHRWEFKTTWLAEQAIHIGGRNVSLLAWIAVASTWLATFRLPRWRTWRRPLGYLALATLAGVIVVSSIKHVSILDCPWDLLRYGGTREFFGWFDLRPADFRGGGCYPAGHASSGYAWLALYFFFSETKPRLKSWGLATGVSAGALFGVAQQFRGAHFLSHDVTTLALCWFLALGLHTLLFYRKYFPPTDSKGAFHAG